MDVKRAEERLRLAASECDALADQVALPAVSGPPPAEKPGRRSSRWLAVAAAVVTVVVLGGLLASRGVRGPGSSSPEVRSGPGPTETGPGWRILDPAALPVKAGAWNVTIEPEAAVDPGGSDSAGRWCLMTVSKAGSGATCGDKWQDRDLPVVIGSPVKQEYLDPTSDLPAPPKGANVMAVAGPADKQIIIGTGADAVPLDQIPAADTAIAVVGGEPWVATAFYVELDSEVHPEVSFARPTGPAATTSTTETGARAIPTPPGATTTALAQDGSCSEDAFPALTSLVPGDELTGQSGHGVTTIRISVPPSNPGIAADRSWMTIEIRPASDLTEVRPDVQIATSTGAAVTAASSQQDIVDGDQHHTLRQLAWSSGADRVLVQSFNVDVDGMLRRLRAFEVVDRPRFLQFLAEHGLETVCTP